MLSLPYLRENRDEVLRRMEVRGMLLEEQIDKVIALDDRRKQTQQQLDEQLAEMNRLSKQIGALYKEGKQEEAKSIKQKTAELKDRSAQLREELHQAEQELQEQLYHIPNVPHESVPQGDSDEDNEILEEHGKKPDIPDARPHWELAKELDIIDFEAGVKVTGAGFPVYKKQGARLQRALISYFLDQAMERGYMEVMPPLLVNEASGTGTGQLPDKEGQMYHIPNEDLYLIPTAEVPITNLYREEILEETALPVKMVGYTPCFRREAGSYGKDVRGLNRLHQFEKVEIVQIQHPERSQESLEEMVQHTRDLLASLGLPFRVARLCGGDLGFAASITYDMEVYSAGQGRWLEVSSVSNFGTYQSNRLKLRYRDEQNKKHLAHTLNGSALALARVVAALIENYQTPEGIRIPEVLVPYTGFEMIGGKKYKARY